MSECLTVSPAYGREYGSFEVAKRDWNRNFDFRICNPGYATYINKLDAIGMEIWVRYAMMTKKARLQ